MDLLAAPRSERSGPTRQLVWPDSRNSSALTDWPMPAGAVSPGLGNGDGHGASSAKGQQAGRSLLIATILVAAHGLSP